MYPQYKKIYQRILESLKAGTSPWKSGWVSRRPQNGKSGHVYRGLNALFLWSLGYSDYRFVTFKQALQLGGHVGKDEHGYPIYWVMKKDELDEDGVIVNSVWKHKGFTVFNVSQCVGLDLDPIEKFTHTPLQRADSLFNTGQVNCQIAYDEKPGNIAAYSISQDKILMPPRDDFKDIDEYYSTKFHELTHATGHPSRLDRYKKGLDRFLITKENAMEELVAEIGGAFLCGDSGISNTSVEDNTAAYLASWLKMMTDDPYALSNACRAAQKACDLVQGVKYQQA